MRGERKKGRREVRRKGEGRKKRCATKRGGVEGLEKRRQRLLTTEGTVTTISILRMAQEQHVLRLVEARLQK